MRAQVFFTVVLLALGTLLLTDHIRLRHQIKALRAERDQGPPKIDTTPAQTVATSPARQETHDTPATQPHRSSASLNSDRIVTLERCVQELSRALANTAQARSVPEYDPSSAPTEAPVQPAKTEKRGWGSEQITGAPDTEKAGDHPTAWASREPDAGPEWLWMEFETPMNIAEVRIRESLNPGAIAKVVAIVNGQELLLWQGSAATGPAPRDFVLRPTLDIWAQTIVVHLDTARVPGWNEIDAVELVGRDGTRQWASAVNASSTYAER